MISRDEILKGQECPSELELNLSALLVALNQFRVIYGIPMFVTSGYRTIEHNISIGGAKNSSHCECRAADFADSDCAMKKWISENLYVLEKCGLYQEAPESTPSWVHLTTRAPPSGSRVFLP